MKTLVTIRHSLRNDRRNRRLVENNFISHVIRVTMTGRRAAELRGSEPGNRQPEPDAITLSTVFISTTFPLTSTFCSLCREDAIITVWKGTDLSQPQSACCCPSHLLFSSGAVRSRDRVTVEALLRWSLRLPHTNVSGLRRRGLSAALRQIC